MAKQQAQLQVAEVKVETPIETELDVLTIISDQIQRLDKDARVRTMKYILDRHSIYIPSSY